jgi:hypothetical protein
MKKFGFPKTLIALLMGFGIVLVLENHFRIHMSGLSEVGVIAVVAMGALLVLERLRGG